MRRLWLLLIALLVVLPFRCVPHPVGPARTFGKFEGKAVTTAESALSEVETVRLAATAGVRKRAFGPYLGQVVSDAEESLEGLGGTFGSIQPPNDAAEQLREELSDLLENASSHVADVRIAIRRGALDDAGEAARPLADDASALRRFAEAHKS